MRVLASMMNVDLSDVINNNYLEELRDCDSIYPAKCKVPTTIKGKLWLAARYRPEDKEIKVKQNQFILVREGDEAVDLEIGTDVYTLTPQAWREKKGYFLAIHPSRLKGNLEQNVKRLVQIRRSNGREKSSGSTSISGSP